MCELAEDLRSWTQRCRSVARVSFACLVYSCMRTRGTTTRSCARWSAILALVAGSPVPGIPQMLLPMFNALRLVWAISTHYSDDTHMCALLQRIAHALCDRAQHSVVIQASP